MTMSVLSVGLAPASPCFLTATPMPWLEKRGPVSTDACPRAPRQSRFAQQPRMGSARRPRAPRARTRQGRADEALADPWSPDKLGFVLVGTVVGAHGVRGEAKVRTDTDFPRERLGGGALKRYLLLPGRRYPRPVGVRGGRPGAQKDHWIVRMECAQTRDEADNLRGAEIYIREGERPRMSRDEFLVTELVGMRVRLLSGADIGSVCAVITREEICAASGGGAAAAAVASDMLEIQLDVGDAPEKPDTTLIPFVKRLVPHVNRKERCVVIDPPEGLLDIARVNNKYVPPPPRGLLMAARGASDKTP